jgi:hypothetical protein
MRFLPRAAAVVAAALLLPAACSERPLPTAPVTPVGAAGTSGAAGTGGGGAGTGGGGAGGVAPRAPAGVLGWAIPVGMQAEPAVPGSTAVTAVVAADDGGAIAGGSYKGRIRFAPDYVLDSGRRAGFVARYRSDQRLVWERVLFSADADVVVADVALIGGSEIVVVGWFGGTLIVGQDDTQFRLASAGGMDMFAARFAGDGSVRWLRRAGGPGDDIARGVAVRASEAEATSIMLTGAIGDGAVFGAGEAAETSAPPSSGPIFVARLDGDGRLVWVRFAGGGVPAQGYAVAAGAGSVAVTGYVNGRAVFGNDVSGAPASVDPSDGRAFVATWNFGGELRWVQALAGPKGEGAGIAMGTAGEAVVLGLFDGTARFGSGASAPSLASDAPGRMGTFLAALHIDGTTLWARRLAGSGVRPWRVRAARGGGFLLAASFGGGVHFDPDGPLATVLSSSGSTDALHAALAADGAPRWLIAGGGPGDERGSDIASAVDGATLAVGDFVGPAMFGTGATFGAGISATLDSGTDGGGYMLRVNAP